LVGEENTNGIERETVPKFNVIFWLFHLKGVQDG